MQRLRALFSRSSTPNGMDFRHSETIKLKSMELACIHAALERNSQQLQRAFEDVREWSEYLRHKLKNKELSRANFAELLLEFSDQADIGQSLMHDRTRIEHRLTLHRDGYPATSKSENGKQTPGKAGSHE